MWNRGRYLVEGAAHCGACHSPKNFLGADRPGLTGGLLQGWYAPDLTSDRSAGLGAWSKADIIEYQQTGRNAHSIASGPMAEAVVNSNHQDDPGRPGRHRHLPEGPATVRRQRRRRGTRPTCRCRPGRGSTASTAPPVMGWTARARAIFPPLAGNTNVTQALADTAARMVVAGSKAVATPKAPTGPGMPSFAWKLDDAQVANVLTYIRNNWGNSAPAVEAAVVERARQRSKRVFQAAREKRGVEQGRGGALRHQFPAQGFQPRRIARQFQRSAS